MTKIINGSLRVSIFHHIMSIYANIVKVCVLVTCQDM